MQDTDILKLAEEMGFSAAFVDTADVVQDPSFRKFCEDNLCGKYNANYSCPPDCGTVEDVQTRLRAGKWALVLQTIWDIGSYENKQGIIKSKKSHNAAVLRFTDKLRQALRAFAWVTAVAHCATLASGLQTSLVPIRIKRSAVCLPTALMCPS